MSAPLGADRIHARRAILRSTDRITLEIKTFAIAEKSSKELFAEEDIIYATGNRRPN